MKIPKVNVDIIIERKNKILLGFLTKKWKYKGKQVYGIPGRDILFEETIGAAVKRSIKEDLGCDVSNYSVIAVNENYALKNHYIGIGVLAKIEGDVQNLKPEDWEKWEWFDKENIPRNLFPAAKHTIDCYLQNKITVSE